MSYIEKNCLFCFKLFKAPIREHNRGYGKFCNQSCSNSYNNLHKTNFISICKQCGKEFNTKNKNSRYCSDICKQRNYRFKSKDQYSIKYFYNKLSYLPCQICGWKEASRDLHHIIPVSKGGKNEENNLIALCPNHHRMVHSKLITESELLKYKNSDIFRTILSS